MKKKRDISSLIIWSFAVLLCVILLSTRLMSNMYARYTTGATDEDSASVAAYVFQLEDGSGSKILDLENIKKPGDTQTYKFSVTNKSGNAISGVAQSYTIKLEVEGSMPIVCEIKEQNSETALCEAENIEANKKQSSSPAITIPAAEEYTQSYTLTATWPENCKDEKYANASGTSVVTLTVDAEQQGE